jgi:hypothetical protein
VDDLEAKVVDEQAVLDKAGHPSRPPKTCTGHPDAPEPTD